MTLPDSVLQLTTLIGYDKALALVQAHGGQRLIIPERASAPGYQYLADIIGPEAAATLAAACGNTTPYIPKCQRALTEARWAAVQADFDSGLTVPQLVAKHHLTDRQIYRALKKPVTQPTTPAPTAQQPLF